MPGEGSVARQDRTPGDGLLPWAERDQIRLSLVMGSEAVLPEMIHTSNAWREVGLRHGIDFETRIISAHDTPWDVLDYAASAESREIEAIVAGSDGSADLPGMVASETEVPVIGVAVTDSPNVLNTALASMIGLPEGTPVGVFQGKKGAYNAGLLAARILALHDPVLKHSLKQLVIDRRVTSRGADQKIREIGSDLFFDDL